MPNRILKESICRSDSIDLLSWFEEVLFYRLIVNCDDYGRFDGRIAIIKGTCFPLKDITNRDIEKALNKLVAVGLVAHYIVEEKPYLQLLAWERHQQIRSKKSKYPAQDGTCNQMISDDCKCPRNPIQSESNPNTNPNPNVRDCATEIEKFFEAYPKPPDNRQATEVAYCKVLLDDSHLTESDLIIAAENYADAVCILGTEERYIKGSSNFLKDNYFAAYLDGNYKKPKPPKKSKDANKGMMKTDYGDMSELEKELTDN